MVRYRNRNQLLKASDEEIERFFSETTFEGIYSLEIRSKNTDFYKGSISDIKLNGHPTNIVPTFLNVPKSSKPIPEGPCSFRCRLNLGAVKQDNTKYIVTLLGGTLVALESISLPTIAIDSKNSKEQDLFEMWGVDNCQCIGYYHYDEDTEVYVVDDLRKPNFDLIPYYPGDTDKKPIRITYPREIKGIKENDYYLFTWKLSHRNQFNPYEIFLDFKTQPTAISPKWFVDTLFNDRHNDKSKNFGSAANFLDTLSKQLSAKESTFVYELLQNANDYPFEGRGVDVEFYITDNYLLFLHSGDKFNIRNISGICGINEKEKIANKKTIGYKGIGFKTVFLNNHYVYLRTGNYSFRFDEGETPEKKVGGKIKRLGAPFQILPIWTNHDEVAKEVNDVFDKVSKDFRVQIALRPDDPRLLHVGRSSYENLFKEVFSDSNIILFIPNINSVRVFINGKEERICLRNNDEWIVGDYESEIDIDFQEAINRTIDKGNSRIPEKYKDFDCTKVSFACKHEGTVIKPVEKATLYCYLPTKASWGFPFLMNSDMIPMGHRNDIETEVKLIDGDETNFNEELAAIAGGRLFDWILDLLKSRRYDLGSVFSLIPNFQKCKKEHEFYEDYIERFEESFNTRVEEELIVPVHKGIANVKHVVLDTTGLSTSGIMTDEEFLKFIGKEEYYLPLSVLREDKNFKAFLKCYANDEQKFDKEDLSSLIENEDFQEWLKVQENNNKFLEYLLNNGYLEDLLDEEIFLEVDGGLYKATNMHYDIDEYLVDLSAFSHHMYYLSPATREYFKGNEKWDMVITDEKFKSFDCEDFVDDVLLADSNIDETIESLKDKDTSIHFYKFLAENVGFRKKYKSLPFFDDNGAVVDSFNEGFVFFSSEKGHSVCESAWLASTQISFLSKEYAEKTMEYFKDNFDVRDFSDDIIINEIILSEIFHNAISKDINDDFSISKSFVDYCYAHEDEFQDGTLSNYSLMVYDGNGDEQWYFADGDVFFSSSVFDYYSAKEWIEADWMVALEEDYYKNGVINHDLKEFLSRVFGVIELDDNAFYSHIIKDNHLNDIIKSTQGDNDPDGSKNIDFVRYLDDNYHLIFEECKDVDDFASFVPVSEDNSDLDISDNVYIYDEELAAIMGNSWFPEDIVYLCSSNYGNSRALKALGCNAFDFGSFYNDVIVEELETISENIKTKEASIAFHNFIIEHLRILTAEQQAKMSGAKVYLYGNDESAETASGHKILSAKAKELSDKRLVEFSDLDIIDPAYKPEQNPEYWVICLKNTKFTIIDFYTWLGENTATFSDTLQDVDLNIEFWHWLKDNADSKQLDKLPKLPIILKDGTIDDDSTAIYFSDEYMNGNGIENIVRHYDKDALFISPDYIKGGDDIAAWKEFWNKVGIKYEIVDILTETIIPNLAEIEDGGLPRLIADNRVALEKYYREDGLIPQLTDLRIKAYDGEFYEFSEIIYVDCEKDEPFKFIELPNQASFATADERRLIIDILDEIKGKKITGSIEWQKAKIEQYLKIQNDESQVDTLRSIHYCLVDELASMYAADKDSLNSFANIKEILFLDSNEEFTPASDLTEGSLYSPFCDFEQFGLDYQYLSDTYRAECNNDIRKMLNRVFKVHCDFEKDDIVNLADRDFALYFWSQYLTRTDADISGVRKLIEDREFDDVACIPTKECMKKPGEVYSLSISSYVEKHLVDWENKLPLKSLPEIEYNKDGKLTLFGLLLNKPSNMRLSFCDSLYALFSVVGKDKRTQLLQWMIESHEEKYDINIDEYRGNEAALWKNTKNENRPITELYALSYNNKQLEQYFGSLPQIINKDYLPAGPIPFNKACDILKIDRIEWGDLITDPIEKELRNDVYKKDLKIYALILAGYEDTAAWSTRFQKYSALIDAMNLWSCSSISIRYKDDENICQNLKKFYHEQGQADFYFVRSLNGMRVFKPFVESFIEHLGIEADKDFVETIMESRDAALEIVQKNNTLMLDELFKDALDDLIPGIKRGLNGNEADDEDIIDEPNRHTFTGHTDEMGENDVYKASDDQDSTDNEAADDYQDETDVDNPQDEDEETEVVSEHYRSGTWVRGHMRNGSNVSEHTQHSDSHVGQENNQSENKPNNPHTNNVVASSLLKSNEDNDYQDYHNDYYIRKYSEVIKQFMGGDFSMPKDRVKSEHIISRYRILMYVKQHDNEYDIKSAFDEKEFVLKDGYGQIPLANGKHINAQGVKYGIWYLSLNVWHDVVNESNYACLCTGNDEDDFIMIKGENDIKNIAERTQNVLLRMRHTDSMDIMDTIKSVIGQEPYYSDTDTHMMLMVHPTPEPALNSIFDDAFNSNGSMEID